MSRILTTIALLGGALLPVFVDVSRSHLFNDLWDAHARAHLVWMLATYVLLFLLGMYYLWVKGNELFPALISLCILVGYQISGITMPLYGGVFLGEGGVEPMPLGVPINFWHFSSMLIIQVIAFALILKKSKSNAADPDS